MIGSDAYPLPLIQLHVAWFSESDDARHTTLGNIAWFTGSKVRMSSNSAVSILKVNILLVQNGRKYIAYIYHMIKQLLTYVSVDMKYY